MTPLPLVDVDVTCPGVVYLDAQLSPLFTVYPVCTEPLTPFHFKHSRAPTNTDSLLAVPTPTSGSDLLHTRGTHILY